MQQQSQIIHANGQMIQTINDQVSGQTMNGQNQQGKAQQYGNQPLNQEKYGQPPQNGQQLVVQTANQGYGQTVTTHTVVQPTVVVTENRYDARNRYAHCVGTAQILIGVLCIIMHGVAFLGRAYLWPVGHGIWCGIFFIIVGSFGTGACCCRTTKCMIATHMVLSIVSAVLFAPALMITSAADVGLMNKYCYSCYGVMVVATAAESILLCLAVIQFIIDIVAAAFCCCCGQPEVISNGQPNVIVMQTPTMTGGQSGAIYMQPGN